MERQQGSELLHFIATLGIFAFLATTALVVSRYQAPRTPRIESPTEPLLRGSIDEDLVYVTWAMSRR